MMRALPFSQAATTAGGAAEGRRYGEGAPRRNVFEKEGKLRGRQEIGRAHV